MDALLLALIHPLLERAFFIAGKMFLPGYSFLPAKHLPSPWILILKELP